MGPRKLQTFLKCMNDNFHFIFEHCTKWIAECKFVLVLVKLYDYIFQLMHTPGSYAYVINFKCKPYQILGWEKRDDFSAIIFYTTPL